MHVKDLINSVEGLEPELTLYFEAQEEPAPFSVLHQENDTIVIKSDQKPLKLAQVEASLNRCPNDAFILFKYKGNTYPLFGFRRVENKLYFK